VTSEKPLKLAWIFD